MTQPILKSDLVRFDGCLAPETLGELMAHVALNPALEAPSSQMPPRT